MRPGPVETVVDRLRTRANRSPRVAIVGDVMLDRYRIAGDGGSAERVAEFPGGAANVAANVAALGGQAVLFAAVGDDRSGRRLRGLLGAAGVDARLTCAADHLTTTKTRRVRGGRIVARHDTERVLPREIALGLQVSGADALADVQAVILSDYRKGVLPDPAPWIERCRDAGIPVLVDTKNPGADCRGADLVTPNLAEVRALLGRRVTAETLATQGATLLARVGSRAVLAKLGADGMLLVEPRHPPSRIPAVGRGDHATGAGDTVISACALAIASGSGLLEAARFAAHAAAFAVRRQGTTAVTLEALAGDLACDRSEVAWGS